MWTVIRKIFRAVFMVVLSILLLIFIAIAFQATLPLLDYLIGSRHDLIEFILWFVCAAGSLLFAILIWDAASAWSAPADSPDKRDWREVFEFRKRWRDYKERRRLYNAPEPPSSTPLGDLPPWLKQGHAVGRSSLKKLLGVLSDQFWAGALFLLFYAIFFGSGIKNFGFVFLVPLLFLIFRRAANAYCYRIQAYLVGPNTDPGKLTVFNLACLVGSAALLIVGVSQFRYSDTGLAIVHSYLGTWAVIFGAAQLQDRTIRISKTLQYTRTMVSLPRAEPIEHPVPGTQIAYSMKLCHLTDLHLTSPIDSSAISPEGIPDKPTVTNGRAAGVSKHSKSSEIWRTFREVLLRNVDQLKNSDAVLISGDLTDTGAAAEWRGFFDAFKGLETLLAKAVIVPGNHDVNTCGIFNADDLDMRRRNTNLIRFLAAVDRIQGDRTYLVQNNDRTLFRQWSSQYTERFARFVKNSPTRTYRTQPIVMDGTVTYAVSETTSPKDQALLELPSEVWAKAFPMLVSVPNSAVEFLVLDSNMPSSNSITNAFGELSAAQLASISEILRSAQKPVILCLHHHLCNPTGNELKGWKWSARAADRGLTMLNAGDLFMKLPDEVRYVAFNGHRHLGYSRLIEKRVSVISGPSTTLGDDNISAGPRTAGFGVYELSWDVDGNFVGDASKAAFWAT